jgi:hypothetical protein
LENELNITPGMAVEAALNFKALHQSQFDELGEFMMLH